MDKFEYKIYNIDCTKNYIAQKSQEIEEELNFLGLDGWEVVSVIQIKEGLLQYLLKRKI